MANKKNSAPDLSAEIEAEIVDIDREKARNKRVLRVLLDKARDTKGHFLAVSAEMGDNRSYITSVPLKWFSRVRFASDQPTFQEYQDTDREKSVAVNKETLDLLSQRRPDWRRQLVMTTYLAAREHRKFPPALLVAYQDWIFDPDSDNWGADGRALDDSVTHEDLDSKSWVIDLDHSKTHFYALDGQHRLMAVKGLDSLLDGNLPGKKKDGSHRQNSISIMDLMEYSSEGTDDEGKFRTKLNSIMDEKIGVEIIPAVQAGETREEAFARLRQIFVDVNQNARRLEKGELALLDENDGFSIVARQVMVTHSLFSRDRELLVDIESNQLNEKSRDYTTLRSIVNMAEFYLGQVEFGEWKYDIYGIRGAGRLRPTDEELEQGQAKLKAYFDALMHLPSHKKMMQGKNISEIRSSGEGCDDNLLFRPIAQEALATAVGTLEKESPRMELGKIIERLGAHDNPEKPDLRLTSPASPFFGILCDPVEKKMRRQDTYRKLAAQMFVYLLGGGLSEDDARNALRDEVAKSRRTTPADSKNPQAIDYDGEQVDPSKIELPHPWYEDVK